MGGAEGSLEGCRFRGKGVQSIPKKMNKKAPGWKRLQGSSDPVFLGKSMDRRIPFPCNSLTPLHHNMYPHLTYSYFLDHKSVCCCFFGSHLAPLVPKWAGFGQLAADWLHYQGATGLRRSCICRAPGCSQEGEALARAPVWHGWTNLECCQHHPA